VTQYDPNQVALLTETFAGVTVENDGSTDVSSKLDTYCDNSGWTGSYVYQGAGGTLKLGSSNYAGSLTTPALDMSTCGGTITVKFNAKYYGSDNSSVVVSCGSASQTVALTASAADYTVVLTGVNAAAGQTVTFAGTAKKKRFYIDNIEIVTGDASMMFKAVETGDANSRIITGITDKYYVVEGLTAGETYSYYVEANYIDGTKATSNIETVTLLDEQGHGYMLGDVNHDGKRSIGDVTALINYLLSGSADDACVICADVNSDGKISIGDVTELINMLLTSNN
jgi:hypothetical protein